MILRTEKICRVFGRGQSTVNAVNTVNLNIQEGESVAIVGKSGAGKSTLLHMMAGLDSPTSGKVFLNKIDMYKVNETKRAFLRNQKINLLHAFVRD